MFVLDELDRLLNLDPSRSNEQSQRIALRDIEQDKVNKLALFDKIMMRDIDIKKELADQQDPINLEGYISNRNYLTVDILFASLMKSLVLNRLINVPERPYPAARLMICDHHAYRHLLKFHYVIGRIYPAGQRRFLLHKPPYNVTAVMLLSDVVTLIDRVGRPIAKVQNSTTVTYDYTIIKQVFPYLKITDLVVVLGEIGPLRLQTLTLGASKGQQIIQFLAHFARSAQLIDLAPIQAKLGHFHLLFDNVSVFGISKLVTEKSSTPELKDQHLKQPAVTNVHLEPSLMQLSLIAQRLQSLLGQLEWHLESITFRHNDPTGLSKIFSRILDSADKTESSSKSSKSHSRRRNNSLVPVRVLVLDRFFDLQGLLRHSDRYGPFLEQENQLAKHDALATSPRLDKADHLDGLLQTVGLHDALKSVLDYGNVNSSLKQYAAQRSNRACGRTRQAPPAEANQISHAFEAHAINRHLDIIKSLYKSMNGGYLLLLKLEACLADIVDKLHKSQVKVDSDEQADVVIERIRRVGMVLEQIVSMSGKSSLTAVDTFRVALMLVDTINTILHKCQDGTETYNMLLILKSIIMERPEYKQTIELAQDLRNPGGSTTQEKPSTVNLGDKFDKFDNISWWCCANRASQCLEEIVELFYLRKLDPQSYPTLKRPSSTHGLIKNVARNKIVVLVLGSISHDELTRVKHMESVLIKRRSRAKFRGKSPIPESISGDVLIMSSDVIRPDELVRSL